MDWEFFADDFAKLAHLDLRRAPIDDHSPEFAKLPWLLARHALSFRSHASA
jgi:hypothetical protein